MVEERGMAAGPAVEVEAALALEAAAAARADEEEPGEAAVEACRETSSVLAPSTDRRPLTTPAAGIAGLEAASAVVGDFAVVEAATGAVEADPLEWEARLWEAMQWVHRI